MKYLTIDTTTKVTALSLAEDGKLIGESFLHTGQTHSERLIPMLDQLLVAADWTLSELDFIAVVKGPGSFTGIRIGIATGQGLAQVLKIPVIGITSLDTLAWAGYGQREDIVVILDARKNEFYYARYAWRGHRACVDGPRAISHADLFRELSQSERPFLLVGDGVPAVKKGMPEEVQARGRIPLPYQYLPRGAYGAMEAWEQWKKNPLCSPLDKDRWAIEPLYIRQSEAEVNYDKKKKNRIL